MCKKISFKNDGRKDWKDYIDQTGKKYEPKDFAPEPSVRFLQLKQITFLEKKKVRVGVRAEMTFILTRVYPWGTYMCDKKYKAQDIAPELSVA